MTAPQPPTIAPHIAHNRALLKQVMIKTKTHSRYPKVSEQVECLPLETNKLYGGAYNPALNSKGWLAYRFHTSPLGTSLAIAQLGDNGNVLSNRALNIAGKSVDDPKLWSFNGDDYISWVEANWDDSDYSHTIRCCVKYAKFNETQVGEIIQPLLAGNDGTTLQKNFVFWDFAGRLMSLYQCHPTHLVYEAMEDGFKTYQIYETDGPRWQYGEIRGGTPPIPYDGKLLRFFHSSLRNESFGPKWRYYMGAYIMSGEPPFKVERVSTKPIVYGSEICHIPAKQRPNHWKANVIFPGSALKRDGYFEVAAGCNDSSCLRMKITPEMLNL